MAEPLEIVAAIEKALGRATARWTALKALVTAGPTHEPIDPVRFLANRSSGKQGYAIADALAGAGADTVLISGPVEIAPPARREAAESDHGARDAGGLRSRAARRYRGDERRRRRLAARHRRQQQDQEGRRTSWCPLLKLVENPDILATLARHKNRPRLVIGFAAETDDVVPNAVAKRARKGADWIIANDVSQADRDGRRPQPRPSDHRGGRRKTGRK